MTTLDIEQKLMLMQLLWAWEYMPHLEVKLSHPEGSLPQRYELTDVDVFGVGITPDFSPEIIVGDCKTLKSVSAINRAFWLKGVMEYLKAKRGYLILRTRGAITEDHKLGAKSIGITLMSENEFQVFHSKLLRKQFPLGMRLFQESSWQYFEQNIASIGAAKRLNEYRKYQYWLDTPSRALRYCLFETREINETIDPRQKLQRALVLDMLTLFSVAFMNMVCHLFHIYLVPEKKDELDSYLKAYVYGGRETYNQINRLRRELQSLANYYSNDNRDSFGDLSLPEWDRFLQLFRTVVEEPAYFREVPRFLRFILFERLLYNDGQIPIREALPSISTYTVKFAIDLSDYFLRATKLHDKLWRSISDLMLSALVEIQGNEQDTTATITQSIDTDA